jgi:hypothetical protein
MKKILPQAVLVLALLMATGATVLAQNFQNEDFVINPASVTIGFSTDEVAEFKAFYKGEDVTSRAEWINAGLTSSEGNRAIRVGPGKFKSGSEPGTALIRATYNGFDAFATVNAQGERIAARLELTGEIDVSRIAVGAEISLGARYAPAENCAGTNCRPNYSNVSSQATWTSSNPDVLQSLGGGRFRGVADGSVQVTVSYLGASLEKIVHVGSPSGSSSHDVHLIQQTPVFTRLDIPTGYDSAFGHLPFQNVTWIPDGTAGYFEVAGNCASRGGNPRAEFERGGMWVFDENGRFLDQRDVCFDTSDRTWGCFEAGGCANGFKIQPVGNGQFIRDLGTKEYGPDRSPVLYEIKNGKVNKLNQLFYNTFSNEVSGSRNDDGEVTHVAYANGKMIAVKKTEQQEFPFRRLFSNVVYSIPEMGKLAEFSNPPPACPRGGCSGSPPAAIPHYYPIFGVGEYFVASQGHFWKGPHEIYRMPSSAELLSGQRPEKVGEIDSGTLVHFAYDTRDISRVALLFKSRGVATAEGTVEIYKATANGLALEQTIDDVDAWGDGLSTKDFHNAFAFSGEYLAYKTCDGRHCELVVRKGSEELSVEPIPLTISGDRNHRQIKAIEISPTGKIMVSSREFQSDVSDELYVYQIREVTGQPTTPTGPGFPPTGPGFPPTGPGVPPPGTIPGQLLEIGFPGTSPAPTILIRFGTINSVTQGNMNISIYNQPYSVNTQNAQLLRDNRSQAALSEFVPGRFVNVFGTLDTDTGTNINASIVRNPLPAAAFPTGTGTAATPSNVTAPTTVAPTNLNTATQNTLGNLEQILLDLQQRFAR